MFQVRYAEDLGIPLSQGSWLISYLGVSSAIGRLFFGKLSDVCCRKNLQMYRTCMLLMGLASLLCPLASSYGALVVYVVVLGLLDGSYIGLMSIVTMDIVGLDNIGPAWGILFFCQSFFYLIGTPVAGKLVVVVKRQGIVVIMKGNCGKGGILKSAIFQFPLGKKRVNRVTYVWIQRLVLYDLPNYHRSNARSFSGA